MYAGCATSKKSSENQGIRGQVRWYEGNLMPVAGDTTYARRAKGVAIRRIVLIYPAVKRDEGVQADATGKFYSKINKKPIKKIETKKDGTFRVALPPGRYSLLVMEKGRFYVAYFDGSGYLAPVTVTPGQFTDVLLRVNYKAVY